MYLDEDTDRLVATGKVKKYFSNNELTIEPGDKVELMVFNQSDLGFEVIINGKHLGLIFRNEVFSPIKNGDKLTGFIKQIREDGKIDVSLQPDIQTHIENSNEVIMAALKTQGGNLNLSDKSLTSLTLSLYNFGSKLPIKTISYNFSVEIFLYVSGSQPKGTQNVFLFLKTDKRFLWCTNNKSKSPAFSSISVKSAELSLN